MGKKDDKLQKPSDFGVDNLDKHHTNWRYRIFEKLVIGLFCTIIVLIIKLGTNDLVSFFDSKWLQGFLAGSGLLSIILLINKWVNREY